MAFICGIILLILSLFGGYKFMNGNLSTLWQPFEIIMIIGAAAGAFIIANPRHIIKAVYDNILIFISPKKHQAVDPLDVLGLIYSLLEILNNEGAQALGKHINAPKRSELFKQYPMVLSDICLTNFIVDYFRIISTGKMSSKEIGDLIDIEIESRLQELSMPAAALNKTADYLPGFGILSAILGIVTAMGSLGGDPMLLGQQVASALIGTFIGLLLGYGLIGPLSSALAYRALAEIKLFDACKGALIATVSGIPPKLAIEFGRKTLFSTDRPSFKQVQKLTQVTAS
ncbi:flagellar motor stator protein MotA [Thalassomonas actiniarum]|uniref:Flagellar motor stator protein MotA n=1 Tax=Thalassomonas actiniarum TaxID=485447 RepID=A0AAF0C6V3_9GAMM|nr:flagellar motor stator protein MotA [Thalassomonas actiniarum]WDE02505.1 flagellar motor stator protein MotA [Thalassomonas actiniarum]